MGCVDLIQGMGIVFFSVQCWFIWHGGYYGLLSFKVGLQVKIVVADMIQGVCV